MTQTVPPLQQPPTPSRRLGHAVRSVLEAPLFVGALAIVTFNEVFNLAMAPAKALVRDLSWRKLMDDLHHSEELLKESRLVKNITGHVWPWLPAVAMMGLLVGIPLVAIAAKGAWLLHLTPYAALTTKIPFLAPFIGTSSAALKTLVGTAIIAKLAKLPAIVIATCFPQFKDSWLHKNINVPVLNALSFIAVKSKDFVMERTQSLRARISHVITSIKESRPVRAVKSVVGDITRAISHVLPKPDVKAVDPSRIKAESDFQLNARTTLHTLLIYGGSTAIPAATVLSAVAGFGAGQAAVTAAATSVGLSVGTILTYTGIGLGVATGGALAVAVALGGIYGVARMSRSLFSRAAQGVCEVGRNADIATAQAMHEGMLLGTVATGGVVEHFVHAKEALLATAATAGGLAMFGGWRKIRDEYQRINDAKRPNTLPPGAALASRTPA